jgi:hypothetical protein
LPDELEADLIYAWAHATDKAEVIRVDAFDGKQRKDMSKELEQRLDAEYQETQRLLRRAWSLGLDVPRDPRWWEDDSEIHVEDGVRLDQLEFVTRSLLTEEGKARLAFLIDEAEIKKETAELDRHLKRVTINSQRISIMIALGGVLVGLIGAAIAALTLYYKH